MLSLDVSHGSKRLSSGIWWPGVGEQYLMRTSPEKLKTVFLEVSFPIDKIKLQGAMLTIIVSWECPVKTALPKRGGF